MARETIRRILLELQRRFRVAGRGSVTRVEQELGLSAGYFKDQRRPERQRFDLRILLRALAALNVSPAEFFASVLGAADPLDVFKSEAAALQRRKTQLPRFLIRESERHLSPRPEQEADLDALEALRHDDPARTLREARSLIPVVPDVQVPRLLGIYASACRSLGRADEAILVLTRALDLAAERDYQASLGDLLLRAGYICSERGQTEMACALAERATLVFARIGDLVGIGRSLLDQGMCFFHLNRPRDAAELMIVALGYLEQDRGASPTMVQMSRWSCLVNLCLIHRSLDELSVAESYARQAREPAGILGQERLLGRVIVLEAAIARDAGRSEEAELLYREAFEIFRSIEPLDSALCGIELVRVQLRMKRNTEAYQTAKAMMPLLEPLEKNRVASAALAELLRSALAGQGLSEALLHSVAGGLQKAQRKTASLRHRIHA